MKREDARLTNSAVPDLDLFLPLLEVTGRLAGARTCLAGVRLAGKLGCLGREIEGDRG